MFPERIKELRNAKGLTQQQIADQLGITRPAYTAYERGKRQPDFEIQTKIADFFGVSLDYLHGRDDASVKHRNEKAETIAAHIDDDASEEDMKDILSFIDYIKKRDHE